MKPGLAAIVAAAVGAAALPLPAWSQSAPVAAATASSTQPLTQAQLEQLVAPIALYPDELVAQILMAATYPLEVVEADRWLDDPQHAALAGDALAAALQPLPWDPSVKSLAPFPRILKMMDSRLDWMEALGDAFLAQQGEVMDAVQRLRQRAAAAGMLQSTPHETVADDGQVITIEPSDSSVVYVPVYNPAIVFAPWPYPDYPPFWFPPPPGYFLGDEPFLWWDVPIVLPLWGWSHWRWHHHGLEVGPVHFRGGYHDGGRPRPPVADWRHDPAHRRGVPYRDRATQARFGTRAAPGPAEPRVYRGFAPARPSGHAAPAPSVRGTSQPQPYEGHRTAPPLFDSYGRGRDVRNDAIRGRASGMNMAPHPFHPSMPHGGAPHGGVSRGGFPHR